MKEGGEKEPVFKKFRERRNRRVERGGERRNRCVESAGREGTIVLKVQGEKEPVC